jgi:subfamily B ATP-binding cassette protein MsbA
MCESCQQMKALLRLKPYLRLYWAYILGSVLLALPLSALRAAPAYLLKMVGDDLLVKKDLSQLKILPGLILGIYLLNFVVRFFHYYFLRVVIARVNQGIRNHLFSHVLGLSADYFTQKSTGSLISRVGIDPFLVEPGLQCINIIVREPITFIVLFAYSLHLNWKLTLLTLLVFPPLAWVFAATSRNLKRYVKKLTEENERIYSTLQEAFVGIRTLKVFKLEGYVQQKFFNQNENFLKTALKIAALEEAAHPTVEMLFAILMAIIIAFGGHEILRGAMSPGDLLAFFGAFALMTNPLRNLNEVNIKLSQAGTAAARIFELLDWKSNLAENANPKTLTGFKNQIEFKSVAFAYPDAPERPILKDVSLSIPRGHSVAVVGQSGAGKSSLIQLLPRLFDVNSGQILIDGEDIRNFSLQSLREQVAIVSQDVFLFNDTIEENIRCGKLNATEEEIREAARKAHALEFIESLPGGFKSIIGDRGQKLSGGERQRLSIARAFLRSAPILLLDEATSSLDSRSERAVQEAIEELMVNRTSIIIAHRLSTIRNANEIVVVKDGKIHERGTHEDLLRLQGEYAHLHLAQQVPTGEATS